MCLGLDHVGHIEETGRDAPRYPTPFAEYDGSLIGAHDPITLPCVGDRVHGEGELGFVIGRAARHVPQGQALGHVAGYTVVGDGAVRDRQRRPREFLSGKTSRGPPRSPPCWSRPTSPAIGNRTWGSAARSTGK